MKRSLLLAVLFLSTAACTRQECPALPDARTVFTGTACGDSVKISIGQRSGNAYPALWQEGDALSVFRAADGAFIGDASLVSGAGGSVGLFVLQGSTGGAEVRLLYPAGAKLSGENHLSCEQVQAGPGARDFRNWCFAFSDVTSSSFTLHHALAYIKLNVKAASSSDTYFGWQIDKASFIVPGENISGDFTLDYDAFSVKPGSENCDYVTVALDSSLTISTESQEIWMSALPVDCTGRQVMVRLDLSSGAKSTSVTVRFTGKRLSAGKVHSLVISDLTGILTPSDPSKSEYTYNTVKYKESADKTSWKNFKENVTIDGMNWMDKYTANTLDKWGGYDGVSPDYVTSQNPSGFWRTGWYKTRPVMVDPDGNVAILHGVNVVRPLPATNSDNQTWRPIYDAKFGKDNASWAQWAGKVLAEDFEMNFYSSNAPVMKRYRCDENGYGNDASTDAPLMHPSCGRQTSHCEITYFLRNFLYDFYFLYPGVDAETTDVRSRFVFLFDPKYPDYIDGEAALLASWFRDDRNFIGYVLDNELDFRLRYKDTPKTIYLKNFIDLPTEGKPAAYACAREYARNFMLSRGVQPLQENITEELDLEFLQDVCEIYYRTAAQALRRHDPNHLLMGSRLDGSALPQGTIVTACGKYSDIITMNAYQYYDPCVSGNHYFYPKVPVYDLVGTKPFLVTEFYTCSAAANYKGLPYVNGGEGIGWIVPNQAARGQWYQNFCIKLLKLGYIVGWEWFQFYDDYNEAGWKNKGITSPTFNSYECAPYFRQMHRNIYQVMEYFIDGGGLSGRNAGSIPNGVWE